MPDHDLILRGARVIDPSQNIDRVTDVRFTAGKVAAIGDGLVPALIVPIACAMTSPW